jgi:hypothetical protein
MPPFNLALPPQLHAARAVTNGNGTIVAVEKRQGHPDKYPCIKCSEHFGNAVGRAKHMRSAHGIQNGFLCHECTSSSSEQLRNARHVDKHFHSRPSQLSRACAVLMCDYRHTSPELMQRHREEDHQLSDDSHQPRCPKCDYYNDSVVGVSVHMLHVHSKEGMANRQKALELRREAGATAKRVVCVPKAALTSSAAANASRTAIASSSTEATAGDASSPTAQPASRKRARSSSPPPPPPRLTLAQQEEKDANAAHSNAFLAMQMAARAAMTDEERNLIGLTHKKRKAAKKAMALEAKQAQTS